MEKHRHLHIVEGYLALHSGIERHIAVHVFKHCRGVVECVEITRAAVLSRAFLGVEQLHGQVEILFAVDRQFESGTGIGAHLVKAVHIIALDLGEVHTCRHKTYKTLCFCTMSEQNHRHQTQYGI